MKTAVMCLLVACNIVLGALLYFSRLPERFVADHVETIHADIDGGQVFVVTIGDSTGRTESVTLTPRAAIQLQQEMGRMFEIMKRAADAVSP